jgi:uncharacterized membrane protein SpoIIM required for sporulation
MSTVKKMLTHKNVFVRAISLWILCFMFLIVAWFVAYYFLPYEVLKGVFPSSYLPWGNSFLSAFFAIFLFNLVVGCGITVAANLISAKSIPLGYLYPSVQVCLFGIFLGTNSFATSQGGRLFPSLTLVTGAGFYELTAYVLVAVATAKLTLWNQTALLGGSLERIKKMQKLELTRAELFVLVFGVLLLLVAAAIEAGGIMGA